MTYFSWTITWPFPSTLWAYPPKQFYLNKLEGSNALGLTEVREPCWGPTIQKKRLTHFVWFRRKKTLSPNVMLIQVVLSEAMPDPSTLIWWGRGRIMIKARTSAFYSAISCPIFYYSGKHGESCNKLLQVYQLFFSLIVDGTYLDLIEKIVEHTIVYTFRFFLTGCVYML